MTTIDSLQALRALYPSPHPRALGKQLGSLDRHCRHFIGLSPFVVIASGAPGACLDASPRGGEPGFIRVRDDATLLIPDAPGNNRLDTLENIIADSRVGLIFLVPGVDETLRVNGRARLSDDPSLLAAFADAKRVPRLVIEIKIVEVYLHCAKALMRSKLWGPKHRVDRAVLPTLGRMINDQIGSDEPAKSQEAMVARYAADL